MVNLSENRIYIKSEKKFLNWENNVLIVPGKGYQTTIDLNSYKNISGTLLSDIKRTMTVKGNYSNNSIYHFHDIFIKFGKFLQFRNTKLFTPEQIDIYLVTDFISILRDNPAIIGLISESKIYSCFITFRQYYLWCRCVGIPGYTKEVANYLSAVSFPRGNRNQSLKHLDIDKGPFTEIEMAILDKFFISKLNEWNSLNIVKKGVIISYWISRETSRRTEEHCALEINDIYEENEMSWIKVPNRKPISVKESSKMPLKISNILYEFIQLYISETQDIRNTLKIKSIFVYNQKVGKKNKYKDKLFVNNPKLLATHTKKMIDNAALPNRLFFSTDIKIEDLNKAENKKYRLLYSPSRARDSYGTHMAILGVPFELLGVRMGHYHRETVKKYYLILLPNIVSDLLSKSIGTKYEKFAEYFFSVPEKGIPIERPIQVLDEQNSLIFGNCKGNYCNYDPRIGCYLCSKFQPVVSDEHKTNLEWLKRKHKEMVDNIREVEGDIDGSHIKMYLRQLNMAIMGAEYIVNQCKEVTQ